MRKLAVVLAVALAVPLAARAQAAPPPGAPPQAGKAMGPGQGPGMRQGKGPQDPRRARLALTLGLAEALDLDEGQTLKLREAVDRFTQKRQPLMLQQHEAMQVLRDAAAAEKADGAAVDQALAKLQEARAQALAADQAFFAAVTKDLGAQKKARAALFLGRMHGRMGRHGGPGGPGGPGPAGGRGHPGQRGMDGMHGQANPPGGMGPGPGDLLGLSDDDLDDDL
jgi:hypothetical protein